METGPSARRSERSPHHETFRAVLRREGDLRDGHARLQLDLCRRYEAGGIKGLFPEFEAYEPECRFLGCVHVGERECGVKEAVKAGKIADPGMTITG